MATRPSITTKAENCYDLTTWAGLASTEDAGAPVTVGFSVEGLCGQLSGTLGSGGEVTMQGSLDGSVWGTLHAIDSTALVLDALGFFGAIAERPLYVRPACTGAESEVTDLTVTICGARR